MTKACSFIKFYLPKPWTRHQKCPILIQLEQKPHPFRPLTGHFACKNCQFCKFLLKCISHCAILNRNMGRYVSLLMWKYSTIAKMHCQALFLCLLPEISGFFHARKILFAAACPYMPSGHIAASFPLPPIFLSCLTVDFLSKFQFNQNRPRSYQKLH